MTRPQFVIIAALWVTLVLAPFTALFVSLKAVPQLSIVGFFVLFALLHRFNWRFWAHFQLGLLWLLVFSSSTTLSYQIYILIAPSCNAAGECAMPISQGALASLTGAFNATAIGLLLWKRGHQWPQGKQHLPFMIHSAGLTTVLAYILQRVLWVL
jgi:hypothetical protein